MEVVVDTNVLMSALIKSSKSRELICSPKLVLHAPEHIISESLAHEQEIISKSGINKYLVVLTGHQGEPKAALSRIVNGELGL